MKKNFTVLVMIFILYLIIENLPAYSKTGALIIDRKHTDISSLSGKSIENAVKKLNIVYGHTSHGSQIMDGLRGLCNFDKRFSKLPFIFDGSINGARDLGQPDRSTWVNATRKYLKANRSTNVVIWSWCGQVSHSSEKDISEYLANLSRLEKEFPSVTFVYMTGHLDGSGLNGNLHKRNEKIRTYCKSNGKVLYDFADIESFDPDGKEYLSKGANDNCDYDSNGDGRTDKNWAIEWQKNNPGKWYNCPCAHSQALNGNRKAYAVWTMFVRLSERVI